MNMFGNIFEDDFCNCFSSFSYMVVFGNDLFRIVFIVNVVLNVFFCIMVIVINVLVIILIWYLYLLWILVNMLLISFVMFDLGVGLIL